jgi:AcrR family transcriptional regulator
VNLKAAAPTRERILDASMALFNERGVQGAAVYKVAAHLGISPGNLAYHFKNKSEVLAALAERLEADLADAFAPFAQSRQAEDVVESMHAIFVVFWRYRFFFNASFDLYVISTPVAERYQRLLSNIRSMVAENYARAVADRMMRAPRAPNNSALIADNTVAVWVLWLQFVPPGDGTAQHPPLAAIRAAQLQHFSLIEPYLNSAFTAELHQLIQARYSAPETSRAPEMIL